MKKNIKEGDKFYAINHWGGFSECLVTEIIQPNSDSNIFDDEMIKFDVVDCSEWRREMIKKTINLVLNYDFGISSIGGRFISFDKDEVIKKVIKIQSEKICSAKNEIKIAKKILKDLDKL